MVRSRPPTFHQLIISRPPPPVLFVNLIPISIGRKKRVPRLNRRSKPTFLVFRRHVFAQNLEKRWVDTREGSVFFPRVSDRKDNPTDQSPIEAKRAPHPPSLPRPFFGQNEIPSSLQSRRPEEAEFFSSNNDEFTIFLPLPSSSLSSRADKPCMFFRVHSFGRKRPSS